MGAVVVFTAVYMVAVLSFVGSAVRSEHRASREYWDQRHAFTGETEREATAKYWRERGAVPDWHPFNYVPYDVEAPTPKAEDALPPEPYWAAL